MASEVAHIYPENRLHRWSLCYGAPRPTSSRKYIKGKMSALLAQPVFTVEGKKYRACWECRNRMKAMLAEMKRITS